MSERAIKIERLGKQYELGRTGEFNLAAKVESAIRAPFQRLFGRPGREPQEVERFWALRDVSFDLAPGQALGLIGANGSGKSTLLKIISGITHPTEGRAVLRGRVGTLLEIGTGFHPELTGRENIFLNGATLGMTRREVERRFDEIVEFSEIPRFLDTPVKRYSSGMYVRLAFAVAAHLEPEILLVDEVLAVGDAKFQRKCAAKMREVAAEDGRTVVFVSHSSPVIRKLCDRVILLDRGRMTMDGPAEEVVDTYLDRLEPVQHGGTSSLDSEIARTGTGEARLKKVSLLDSDENLTDSVGFGEPFTVVLEVEATEPTPPAMFLVGVDTPEGSRVLTSISKAVGKTMALGPGVAEIRARFEAALLPGEYVLDVSIHDDADGTAFDNVERVLRFTARDGSGRDHWPWPTAPGSARPETHWQLSDAGVAAAPRNASTVAQPR